MLMIDHVRHSSKQVTVLTRSVFVKIFLVNNAGQFYRKPFREVCCAAYTVVQDNSANSIYLGETSYTDIL